MRRPRRSIASHPGAGGPVLARFLHQVAHLHGLLLGGSPARWNKAARLLAAAMRTAGDPRETPAP
eukprot:353616-Lingulodinium_polyedra.AAC.1